MDLIPTDPTEQIQEISEGEDAVPNLGFSPELIDEIRSTKMAHPEMFVSSWDEDITGVEVKDMESVEEQFLTAAENDDLELLQKMLENNPDLVHTKDKDGYTALHRASYNNHLKAIEFLLEKGADAEARTELKWTPLMSAANWANCEAVGLLISRGVSVNAVSKGNVSALHIALTGQSDSSDSIVKCVRYLLEAPGIDVGIINRAGDSPLMIARRSSKELFELISDHIQR